MSEQAPLRVLFLCTHNSSRSQMAEGLLRARGGLAFEVFSAGTEPGVVHSLAIRVMQEIGIDISIHRAKSLEEFRTSAPMDLVVTVCNEAAEACPFFSNARFQVHWGFVDPSQVDGSEEQRLAAFRQTRDHMADRLDQFLHLQPFRLPEQMHMAAKAQEEAYP
jgi:arsenate reductase